MSSLRVSKYWLYIPLIAMAIFYLLPMYVMLITGFKSFDEIDLKTMWDLPRDCQARRRTDSAQSSTRDEQVGGERDRRGVERIVGCRRRVAGRGGDADLRRAGAASTTANSRPNISRPCGSGTKVRSLSDAPARKSS